MIPELGYFSLVLALCTATALCVLPLLGAYWRQATLMGLGAPLSIGLLALTSISFACLAHAFLNDDFSVVIVATNSNSLLPDGFKFAAIWGGHEGSLVLWILMLAGWTAAVAMFSSELPLVMQARVLAVLGGLSVGFLLFSIFTSNPFARYLPVSPLEGQDLNPLLQDFGLIIHPPMLYLGYVGFSVAFAFALAALMGGRLDATWARWSRPWTNLAWAFLTTGIMLGSWWAYYELGWGGWWFWDPVENASFMPWLAGTALIHSLAVTEKRGVFKSWTVLLAIFAFSLSLLGTFLVRSGVLTSVHAFATDPTRGVFILVFLGIVVGGSLTLYALRAPAVQSRVQFNWLSREVLVLLNNIVFLSATLTVLFGTLFPLFMDALGQGKYSVGPPYFNAVFVPMMAVLMTFMGIGPLSRWKRDKARRWLDELLVPACAAVVVGLLFPLLYGQGYSLSVAIAVTLSSWVIFSLLRDLKGKLRNANGLWHGLRRLTPSYYGMQLAHLGFALSVIGVCLTSAYSIEKDVRMAPGDSQQISNVTFQFVGIDKVNGPNYVADEGIFRVTDGSDSFEMRPQKRRYAASGTMMTEAAIDAALARDLFIALGEPLTDGSWAIRIYHKPFIRFIWLGALFMAAGAGLTLADRRYRRDRITADVPLMAGSVQNS
ncbi:MAG: cytochrome c-type biogenesis protein CcmF [Halieaceae bacterium]|jgi:cytochrome c-type biogenesis protein CcmF